MNIGSDATAPHAVDPDSATLLLDGRTLRIDDVILAATRPGTECQLAPASAAAIAASRGLKDQLIATGQPIYGVTTGFGDSVVNQVSATKAARLQENMVQYHRTGTGPSAPDEIVRATLLIRANCLARGNSGVSPDVVYRLLDLLRHDIHPVIPERGSVGASGDLVPLSYVASVLIGHGTVRHRGIERDAADVFAENGLAPVRLAAKDALALLNGTSFSSAWAVLACERAQRLARATDICTALATESLLGNRGHFAAFVHDEKPHPGQIASARLIRRLLHGSRLARSPDAVVAANDDLGDRTFQVLEHRIQNTYSIRCTPHVNGVLRDTVAWVSRWLDTEINSSNDNPLFEVGTASVHNGGNFYAGHVVQAMDALRAAVAGIADLLDRQLELLVDTKFSNGLPANLIPPRAATEPDAGLHHGFKGVQLTCSALTAEVQQTCMPVSVFSRSTEAHNQDKVSMAPISARATFTATKLVTEVVACHLLAACQAIDLRGAHQASPRTTEVHRLVREHIPFVGEDRRMDDDIHAVRALLDSGAITNAPTLPD